MALGQTIPNPSFEANSFTTYPGYISVNAPITGWTANPADEVGLNPAGGQSPFADNGAIPDGTNVAFIQAGSAVDSQQGSLSTTISGLDDRDHLQSHRAGECARRAGAPPADLD